MAIKCGFFNSVDGDRLYSAEEMTEPYKGIISDGVLLPNEDLPGELTSTLSVAAGTGMNVIVKPGRGMFAGKWLYLDIELPIQVPTNNTLTDWKASIIVRIDTRAEHRSGNIELIMDQDNPAQVPAINNIENVFDFRLANITIRAGATSITDLDITDTRGSDECGFCHGLLKQISTDEFFTQWQAMFNDWFQNVQVDLTTRATLVTSITSSYTSSGSQRDIPIGISQYNHNLDALEVYISGIAVRAGDDYTILDSSTIRLNQAVDSGTKIMFRVYKSIKGSQAESIVPVVQDMVQDVNDLQVDVNNLTQDSEWINFILEGGAVAYPGMTPAVRKVGNVVYIRGAIYQVTNAQQVVCTLPEAFAPNMEHFFSHVVGGIGAGVGYTTVRFRINRNAASGGTATITLNGSTGTLNADMTIPMSTSFIVG